MVDRHGACVVRTAYQLTTKQLRVARKMNMSVDNIVTACDSQIVHTVRWSFLVASCDICWMVLWNFVPSMCEATGSHANTSTLNQGH